MALPRARCRVFQSESSFAGTGMSVLQLHSTNELLSLLASHDLNIDAILLFDPGNKVGDVHVRLGLVSFALMIFATLRQPRFMTPPPRRCRP
jgi:hypothetical protein